MGMNRQPHPTDLREAEGHRLAPLLPRPKAVGRPPKDARREIVNAIRYVVRSGYAWRLLPHDLPSWRTAYFYFRQWRLDGTWTSNHDRLPREVRRAVGCHRQPSAALLDSQLVKPTDRSSE